MKRIFLTSTLLLSFFAYSQSIDSIVKVQRAEEDKVEAEDAKGACDVFKPREKKEKEGCLKYWAGRLKTIQDERRKENADIKAYYQYKEILMNKIREGHDHCLVHPEDYDVYTDEVIKAHKIYVAHAQKCYDLYRWGDNISVINVTYDPETVYKVTMTRVKDVLEKQSLKSKKSK